MKMGAFYTNFSTTTLDFLIFPEKNLMLAFVLLVFLLVPYCVSITNKD